MATIKVTPRKPGQKVTWKPVKVKIIPWWSPKAPWFLTNKPWKKKKTA